MFRVKNVSWRLVAPKTLDKTRRYSYNLERSFINFPPISATQPTKNDVLAWFMSTSWNLDDGAWSTINFIFCLCFGWWLIAHIVFGQSPNGWFCTRSCTQAPWGEKTVILRTANRKAIAGPRTVCQAKRLSVCQLGGMDSFGLISSRSLEIERLMENFETYQK